ncbi:hypothetical protein [Streptomyces sp. NBC_00448]|uniref:hypothetical protein n=1 Tax=Streptomyces sp. NBC_00448 TaxID=2903652 RepID=UPI002E1DC82E
MCAREDLLRAGFVDVLADSACVDQPVEILRAPTDFGERHGLPGGHHLVRQAQGPGAFAGAVVPSDTGTACAASRWVLGAHLTSRGQDAAIDRAVLDRLRASPREAVLHAAVHGWYEGHIEGEDTCPGCDYRGRLPTNGNRG